MFDKKWIIKHKSDIFLPLIIFEVKLNFIILVFFLKRIIFA